ncbi:CobW family GTP-binding protein [Blautia sp. An46]|uniref:CobW family GTP-binding protein n=1 Tax=Blautia sp. An46 TaxID=1965636 RepID=UPI000B39A17F|nr:CobW family GTP-binding protein [Blautia sp. An46]OUN93632.1 cobalamin biosynthesis protein CobW [Blautia sp. An46]HJD37486.1 GTP-binding protein [Candidatus Blautia ornithocaccae]
MTKIDIFSGFLGAGKTTLIQKLLKEAYKGEQVVLIENEFGEIGIDGGFLKEAGIEIREMNSGCICCSLVGDFGEALKEVIGKYSPDRIIIEPSGVGKLSDVIKAVQKIEDSVDIKLNSFTTLVDVTKCKMYMKNFGEFFSNQIEYAGTIILSRTDTEKATQEKVEAAVELIRSLNKTAAVITTPIAQLSGEKILNTMENNTSLEKELMEEETCPVCGGHHHHHDHEHHHEGCDHDHHHHDHEECDHHHHDHEECDHDHDHHDHEECGHDHHHHDHEGCGHDHHHGHHHADEVFTSWGKETVKAYSQEEIQKILDTLSEDGSYGMVLRAKGMVEGKDGQWIYFDMVPGEADIRQGAPDYTGRLCVIGSKLAEDKLAELFGV